MRVRSESRASCRAYSICETVAHSNCLLWRGSACQRNDPALRAKVTQFGGTPLVGSSAEFEQLFVRDSEKWAKVVQTAGARTQ